MYKFVFCHCKSQSTTDIFSFEFVLAVFHKNGLSHVWPKSHMHYCSLRCLQKNNLIPRQSSRKSYIFQYCQPSTSLYLYFQWTIFDFYICKCVYSSGAGLCLNNKYLPAGIFKSTSLWTLAIKEPIFLEFLLDKWKVKRGPYGKSKQNGNWFALWIILGSEVNGTERFLEPKWRIWIFKLKTRVYQVTYRYEVIVNAL